MKIAVIIGTTRQGRVTPKLAKWVETKLREKHDDVEVLDLVEYDMPLLPEAPWTPNRTLSEGAKQWLKALETADSYMFVTAEYNHGVPAVLKNALDYTNGQLNRKPAGIVSHGVVSGARANEHLRMVLASKIGVAVLPDTVTFHGHVDGSINDDGSLTEEAEKNNADLDRHIDDLLWYTKALKEAR
ncbi:TPA: hypothetical protein DIV49_02435 [Candidatus Saccharibacteria bacterium]|nr:hypothetical protein [Candidatus Saccharibacteria bacterium]HRJ91400.1 NAD(P)H-dependent oxidoreductase [Candidatus Saccharibacteria bacterium]